MTPTININLATCQCPIMAPHGMPVRTHQPECGDRIAPILIPCPIPRSVTMKTVRLGECTCLATEKTSDGRLKYPVSAARGCTEGCAGKPIRVSCSIGGRAWPETFVDDIDPDGRPESTIAAIRDACDARWEIVKALVLYAPLPPRPVGGIPVADRILAMAEQRNTVFAALARMARAEEVQDDAYARIWRALVKTVDSPTRKRASHHVLAHYVDLLIDQVGSLP